MREFRDRSARADIGSYVIHGIHDIHVIQGSYSCVSLASIWSEVWIALEFIS